jgi:hypothetical protein
MGRRALRDRRRAAVASLLGAVRAVGQDAACRRPPARDPIGHDQLYQAARCGLCLVERRK